MLLRHAGLLAEYLALAYAGSSMAARMAMIAMTTNNSMRVKPKVLFRSVFIGKQGRNVRRR